jgi:uncharacterized protein YbdZ (MbtH family)
MDFVFKNYNELIEYAKSQHRIKTSQNYYELHHIIPKHQGGTDDESNLVYLTVYEHILAHYLRAKEYEHTNKRLYYQNIYSANVIFNFGKSKRIDEKLKAIEDILNDPEKLKVLENIKLEWTKASSEKQKGITNVGRFWITDGINNKELNKGDIIPEGWKKGATRPFGIYKWSDSSKQKMSIRRSQTCYVYNDNTYAKEILKSELEEYLKNGWQKGRNPKLERVHSTGYKQDRRPQCWIHKDDREQMCLLTELDDYLSFGWIKGRIPITENQKIKMRKQKNTYWITDGTNSASCIKGQLPPEGWRKGRVISKEQKNKLSKPSNKLWITDGLNNKRWPKDLDIPKNWKKGRIMSNEQKEKLKGPRDLFWITDDFNCKQWPKNKDIPEGWRKGRVIKK